MALPELATAADLERFDFPANAAGKLARASTRVRRCARQQISPGTSTTVLVGVGPWLLPQRPVVDVTSVLDADGEPVEYELIGQHVHTRGCAPLTVTYSHGFDPIPDDLIELVCQVASRLASTPAAMAAGARTEQAGGESVTWGADAYAGTSDLTAAEIKTLRKIYPKRPRTVILL